ncbi:MAG: tRNA (adenosine(37)-N6)-threonylcarbamoyltransferase complex transferase subunit TsaD [Opitutaceae bacterium]|nr:tRNA (adenosine(37)-N6)-threonylcarbamoyltransferase complex transferase subunit TsaD [Opitutaceae bacterium]
MIFALETSCDETAAALFDPTLGLRREWVVSQMALHERYGGVVPDLATREHLRTLSPLFAEASSTMGGWSRVTQIAVTHGPGLAGCLAIGVAAAKALAQALSLPLAGVNHLRGHAFSPFINLHAESPSDFRHRLAGLLPHLGLIVSGGNSLLLRIDENLCIQRLATTRDDAAGEALDKGAKLLGLGYPGGPRVERLARDGRDDAFDFPRGTGPRTDLDFSFSGLKTSLRYTVEKMAVDEVEVRKPDLCASYQRAVIDALLRKTGHALAHGGYRSLGLSGGVANNGVLRTEFARVAKDRRLPVLIAEPRHTGDNASMIAFAAWLDPQVSFRQEVVSLEIVPDLELA